jgi:hypothetical protein
MNMEHRARTSYQIIPGYYRFQGHFLSALAYRVDSSEISTSSGVSRLQVELGPLRFWYVRAHREYDAQSPLNHTGRIRPGDLDQYRRHAVFLD